MEAEARRRKQLSMQVMHSCDIIHVFQAAIQEKTQELERHST